MNPEQAAAFINAQVAMCLLEMEGMKARDRCMPDAPYTEQAYLDLYQKYEHVLGYNAVLGFYQGLNR